jgi:putative endonuclease
MGSMTRYRQVLGRNGETQAINYLNNLGYQLVARNYRTPHGEIDLIMMKDDLLIFVEVKTRRSATMGFPEISVNARKLNHFLESTRYYLSENDCLDKAVRLDVVSIQYSAGNTTPQIFHFENIQS